MALLKLFVRQGAHGAPVVCGLRCGEELIKIRVNPVVPNIPQEVKLFPGQFDGSLAGNMGKHGYETRGGAAGVR